MYKKFKRIISVIGFTSITMLPLNAVANNKKQELVWNSIETEHYNIVFKSNLLREAQRMANTLEYLHTAVGKSLGANPGKIDVFLDNEDLTNNGSTSRARIELITFPPADHNFSGANDWLLFLATHELRHQAQTDVETKGIVQLIQLLGGGIFTSNYIMHVSRTPRWFYEGDAVCIETALTNYGRGSMPHYIMNHKSMVLEGPYCNYFKAWNRSYKDQVPGAYQMGYVLTNHMRRNYGIDVIKNIYDKMSCLGYPVFHFALKKVTGKSVSQLYLDANEELKQLWLKQLDGLTITPSEKVNIRSSDRYCDYMHPALWDKDSILALKIDKNNFQSFVAIDLKSHKEIPVLEPYQLHEKIKISVKNGILMWLENRYPLISSFGGSVESTAIVYFDAKGDKKARQVLAKGRFISADLSNSKKFVLVVGSDESYNHFISILDFKTGLEVKRFQNLDNKLYQSPSWSSDDKYIISSVAHNGKASIELIDVETGVITNIIDPCLEHLGNVIMHRNYIFHQSSYSGIDNIYAIDLTSKKRYQVTSKKYGAFSPCISEDGARLYFSNYTKYGLDIDSMLIDPMSWTPIEQVKNSNIYYERPLVDQENNKVTTDLIPQNQYPVKRYYPILHICKINGWMPDIFAGMGAGTGIPYYVTFGIQMEDLNRWLTQEYSIQHNFVPELTIKAKHDFNSLIPLISLKSEIKTNYKSILKKHVDIDFSLPFHFPITSFDATLTAKVTPKIGVTNNGEKIFNNATVLESTVDKELVFSLDYIMYGSVRGVDNIVDPKKFRIGGIYDFSFTTISRTDINDKPVIKDEQSNGKCLGFLIKSNVPGFFDRDIFVYKTALQFKEVPKDENGKNTNSRQGNLSFVRNLRTGIYEFYTGNLASSKVTYIFPILHPDLALGHLLYWKRTSGSIFSEFVHLPDATYYKKVWTFGGAIYSQVICLSSDFYASDSVYKFDICFTYGYTPQGFIDGSRDYRHNFSIFLKMSTRGIKKPIDLDFPSSKRDARVRPGYQRN